jgi:hypothetical protein
MMPPGRRPESTSAWIDPAFFTSLMARMCVEWPPAVPEPSASMPSVVPNSEASTSCTPTALPVITPWQ